MSRSPLVLVLLTMGGALQGPVFRAGVDYVTVDVVVTDKDDKPVTDLRANDFEIVERGKTQTISDFKFVSVPVEHRTADATGPASPPPDVAANTPPSPQSRLFVLIVDDLHLVESDIIAVKHVMTDFLEALAPDDKVAVVFVSHSNLSQNFTTDRAALLKTVDRVRASLGFGLDALGKSISTDLVSDSRVVLRYAHATG